MSHGSRTGPSLDRARDIITHALPDMEGWCSPEKGIRLAELVHATPGHPVVVELGVFGGRSLLSLVLGYDAREDRWTNPCPVLGVDPFEVAADLEGTNDPANAEWWQTIDHERIYRGCVDTLRRYVSSTMWEILRVPSTDPRAIHRYGPSTITLLHQDSNHSEEVSCREIRVWEPKLAPDGLWVMDDADWPSMQAAKALMVERGWEIRENYAEHWLVWGRA